MLGFCRRCRVALTRTLFRRPRLLVSFLRDCCKSNRAAQSQQELSAEKSACPRDESPCLDRSKPPFAIYLTRFVTLQKACVSRFLHKDDPYLSGNPYARVACPTAASRKTSSGVSDLPASVGNVTRVRTEAIFPLGRREVPVLLYSDASTVDFAHHMQTYVVIV